MPKPATSIFKTGRPIFIFALFILGLGLAYPLLTLLSHSFFDQEGKFVGLVNLAAYVQTPGLAVSFFNTIRIGLLITLLTVTTAFVISFTVTHTRAVWRGPMSSLSLLPLFVPSVFPALGLIYLFGNQGVLKFLLGGTSLYGPLGIVLGGVIYCLPHAVIILIAALREIDATLYDAARTLGAGPARRFFTVTLPGAGYGLINASIVVFLLTIADFGVPKVLGGDYPVLATDIFKQVIGLQNFSMGATVSMALLTPAAAAFTFDAWARRRRKTSGQIRALNPLSSPVRDLLFTVLGWGGLALPLAAMAMVAWGSLVGFWPYDLSPSLANYSFNETIYGLQPLFNSLILALGAAVFGTALIFGGAYVLERSGVHPWAAIAYRLLAILPLCVPGTVLGLAYIMAFNRPGPLADFVYGSMSLLILNSVIHFFSVAHLTASGSLARLDPNYEKAGACLGVPGLVTFWRVIVPVNKNTLLDISFYLFINALTTISAVIFIYSPATVPASVAILQMFDSGQIGQASALSMLILFCALAARLLFFGFRSRNY